MGGHPWHTHRVTTGCSVWLGPKKLRAPRPCSPVRPMGFLGWTSLLSWPPATGRADPRGLRGPSEALGDRGLSWKRKGCPWEQRPGPRQTGEVLCPRDRARGHGGRRGQGRHPEVSHGCGHRQGSVVGGTRPGGRSLAHRLVPAPRTPALARTPRVPWCPQGQLLVPFLPTTSYPKRHVLTGVGLVTSALKREEKPATPAIPGPRASPSPTPGTASQPLPVPEVYREAHRLRPQAPHSGLRCGGPQARLRSSLSDPDGPRRPPPRALAGTRQACAEGLLPPLPGGTPGTSSKAPSPGGGGDSQREPVLDRVAAVEAAAVGGAVHGVVADPGQRFRGAGCRGAEGGGQGVAVTGLAPAEHARAPRGPRALPATCHPPGCPGPRGGRGAPPRRSPHPCPGRGAGPQGRGAHSLSRGVHQGLVLSVRRVEGRVIDEKLHLHRMVVPPQNITPGAPAPEATPQVALSWSQPGTQPGLGGGGGLGSGSVVLESPRGRWGAKLGSEVRRILLVGTRQKATEATARNILAKQETKPAGLGGCCYLS